jgi:NADPH-dependent 7-cyano-7-deazaguanine reductase QueF
MYEHLKRYVTKYRTFKTHDPMMLRIFEILLADLESDIITQIKKGL